jgi:phosphoserine phosphatase
MKALRMLYQHNIDTQYKVAIAELSAYDQSAVLQQCLEQSEQVYCTVGKQGLMYYLPASLEGLGEVIEQNAMPLSDRLESAYAIAAEGLSMRMLSAMLYEMFDEGVQIGLRQNAFSYAFGTLVIDVFVHPSHTVARDKVLALSAKFHADILRKTKAKISRPGLLLMDMDSTVIEMECIDEIAGLAGLKAKVSAVTERAMRGEIPFTESLHQRVACLAGVAEQELFSIRERLPFMPGFVASMRILKEANWTLALASGGFTFFADYIKHMLELDAAFSNQLEVVDGLLTGKVLGEVVDAKKKAQVLLTMIKETNVDAEQVIAIGDGANDLLMMEQAASSIAYHAKPAVAKDADTAINICGFEGVLYSLR